MSRWIFGRTMGTTGLKDLFVLPVDWFTSPVNHFNEVRENVDWDTNYLFTNASLLIFG